MTVATAPRLNHSSGKSSSHVSQQVASSTGCPSSYRSRATTGARDEANFAKLFFIQNMPVTKTVNRITLGDLALSSSCTRVVQVFAVHSDLCGQRVRQPEGMCSPLPPDGREHRRASRARGFPFRGRAVSGSA
jgi:hypothetical protein